MRSPWIAQIMFSMHFQHEQWQWRWKQQRRHRFIHVCQMHVWTKPNIKTFHPIYEYIIIKPTDVMVFRYLLQNMKTCARVRTSKHQSFALFGSVFCHSYTLWLSISNQFAATVHEGCHAKWTHVSATCYLNELSYANNQFMSTTNAHVDASCQICYNQMNDKIRTILFQNNCLTNFAIEIHNRCKFSS